MAEAETDKEAEYLQAIRSNRDDSGKRLRQAIKGKERLDEYAKQAGEDTMPDPEPGVLYKILDTLDTPHQWAMGGIAKLTGYDGYKDLGFIDAAKKASSEDLNTGKLLRQNSFFKDHDILRGVASFYGDVLTDPLSYVNVFGAPGKMLGGTKVTQTAVKTNFGIESAEQIAKRIASASEASQIADYSKMGGLAAGEQLPERIMSQIKTRANIEGGAPFKSLRNLNASLAAKKDLPSDVLKGMIEDQAQEIAKKMGIQAVDNVPTIDTLNSMVRKPRITLSGPLGGTQIFGRMPLLGGEELNIPVISDLSEKVYDTLAKGYYGTPVKIRSIVDAKRAANPESKAWQAIDAVGHALSKGSGYAVAPAKLLSLRVQTSGSLFGSGAARDAITESARARGGLGWEAADEARFILRNVLKRDDAEAALHAITDNLQQYSDKPEIAYQVLAKKFGPDVAKAAENVRTSFDVMGQEALSAGHIQGMIKGYIHHAYNPTLKDGSPDINTVKLIENWFHDRGAADFSAKRTFGNMRQAEAAGLNPEKNMLALLTSRLYWQKIAREEKNFFERFAYQWSMTKPAYDELNRRAFDASDKIAAQGAQRAADSMGLALNPQVAIEQSGLRRSIAGLPLTEEYYRKLKVMAENPMDLGHARALEEIQHMGLKFTPEEAMQVAEGSKWLKGQFEIIPGRYGESTFTRAGAQRLDENFRISLKKRNLSDEEKLFWEGELPNGFVDAYRDQVAGFHTLQALEKSLAGETTGAKSGLRAMLNGYKKHHKIMKMGATITWPAYWIRNLSSAFFQPLEAASTLGDAINPLKAIRNARIMRGEKNLMTKAGETLTADQIRSEWMRGGIADSATMLEDILPKYADAYHALVDSQALRENVRVFAKAADRQKEMSFGKKLLEWGQALEAHGRKHAYINFRENGMDATSAMEATNRLMIDYAHGKTAFEKNVLNNVFFFYAFSRGNASNMFHAMAARPGALTAQLHAHKAIAEMLTDPDNYVPYPDAEKTATTFRSQEQLSTYLGVNPDTGLPRLLTGTGLPVEDLGRWAGIVPDKPDKMTWNEAMLSMGDSVSKGAQTVFAQANPAIRSVFEHLVFKRNLYFNRDINDETLRKVPAWERDLPKIAGYHFNAIPEFIWEGADAVTKNVLGGKKNPDGTYTINPYAMTVLTDFVPFASRILSTRSAMTAPGVGKGEKFARYLSGVHVDEVDPNQAIAFDLEKKAQDYYRARGVPTTKRKLEDRLSVEDE